MVGNLGVKNTKSIIHQTCHAVSEWRPDVNTEKKKLPKFLAAKCGQTAPNWPLLFAILRGSSYLITIISIIWKRCLKFCVPRGENYILRTLYCSKYHVLFIENEKLKENKNSGGAFRKPIFCIIEAKELKQISLHTEIPVQQIHSTGLHTLKKK